MSITGTKTFVSPTRIHHAIDQVTALKIELQRLRRQNHDGATVHDDHLAWLEQTVDQLAATLIECRDQDQPVP